MLLFKQLIRKKRDGLELSPGEIRAFVKAVVQGQVPDYQIAAFLMAAFINGLSREETAALTRAMTESGRVLSWPEGSGPYVDKHSTGGVGDKISLVLTPVLACCGVKVPMISGRSLGHTGGTLDKMESIPGYKTAVDAQSMTKLVQELGCVIVGQSQDMVPGDKKLYALRDATETVESIPLITASIASKKLAEGIDALVLDVKTGSGAFMARFDRAVELAMSIGRVVEAWGKGFAALITDMDQPLGNAVGNALELREALEVLGGHGPADVRELSLALAAKALEISGVCSHQQAIERANRAIESGCALRRFEAMVKALGGDLGPVREAGFGKTKLQQPVLAERAGYIRGFDTRAVGLAATLLGAGRMRAEDKVDHAVGLLVNFKRGDKIEKGAPVFTVFANQQDRLDQAVELLKKSFVVAEEPPEPRPLIMGLVQHGQFHRLS